MSHKRIKTNAGTSAMPMGSDMTDGRGGNLSTLIKVDKLRELIGTRISLPQLVVVGDQSSGKSSVLEGITGFAFPRAAELCTRYCTQITCRRELESRVHVSIIPHNDAAAMERDTMRNFHETLTEISNKTLTAIFTKANKTMGIRMDSGKGKAPKAGKPAFSEHILKIEICGPDQDHFTVIDVPGIFRRETAGLTTERDIELVRKMVKNCMKDERTIILAIIPSNVDPATQEILKLAKAVDPRMTRTMGVLTKPDLNIERATQKIAIDHVTGRRSDLTLGYYIVKNRGADDLKTSLEEGQLDEEVFFARDPWSVLRSTNRAGITALKSRVRELLEDLIRKEFPKLKSDVIKELTNLRAQREAMGLSRGSPQAQRAFLSSVCVRFEDICRDALAANYTGNAQFFGENSVKLITQIVTMSELFSGTMWQNGHTHPFARAEEAKDVDANNDPEQNPEDSPQDSVQVKTKAFHPDSEMLNLILKARKEFSDLHEISDIIDMEKVVPSIDKDIMDYIKTVYNESRGLDLGTFGGALLGTMFKHQSQKWEQITLTYVSLCIAHVHHFISEALKDACPDAHVRGELWNDHLLDALLVSYQSALDHARFLLKMEREGRPFTLNRYFNDHLQKAQAKRIAAAIEALGKPSDDNEGIHLSRKQLNNISTDKANSQHLQEQIHDILQSYYDVSLKRFVDVVFQQSIEHHLLTGEESPVRILSPELVMTLNDDQLDMIAGEDASVRAQRAKLERDIEDFNEALKVLKGWK